GPGATVGLVLGVTPLAGVFVFTFVAQVFAALVNLWGLRPDPLLTARQLPAEDGEEVLPVGSDLTEFGPEGDAPRRAPLHSRRNRVLTIVMIAMAQAIMVGLM